MIEPGAPLAVLIVEDNPDDATLVQRALGRAGFDASVTVVDTAEALVAALAERTWDIALSDHEMPGFGSAAALRVIAESGADLPVVVVSGRIGEEAVAEAVRAGAYDYLSKDDLAGLRATIVRCLREHAAHRDRRLAEEALRHNQARMAEAQQIAHLGNWEWDVATNAVTWSDELFRIYGLDSASFAATFEGYVALVHPDDRERVGGHIAEALDTGRPFDFEERIVRADGEERVLHSMGRVIADQQGTPARLVGVCRDITDLRRSQDAQRDAEERFRHAFESAPIGMALVGLDGRWLRVNTRLCEITGYAEDQLLGASFQTITHPDDLDADLEQVERMLAGDIVAYEMEKRYIRPDGSVVWILLSVSLVRDSDGSPRYFVSQVQDIDERKRFEGQLQHLADHDALTGLFNRRRLMAELDRQAEFNSRYGGTGAVLVLDLDRFKDVNDTLGHAAGDEVIVRVGRLLRERMRSTDVVARLGGDEFAILLPQADEDEARGVAEGILEQLRREAVLIGEGRSARLSASIGVSMLDPRPGATGESALVDADIALYQAKDGGRDRYSLLRPGQDQRTYVRSRLTWVQRLRDAIENDQFVLYEQPILDLSSNRITRHELLLRLIGEQGEHIPPGAFLHYAEDNGLIPPIDAWVTRQAVRLIADHQRVGSRLNLEVNLSGASISDPALLDLVSSEIANSGIDPTSLIFEVTETAAIVNIDQAGRFAHRLADLGCAFALDDFGSGFGSFYYLKHLPFDYLKIDGDFIRALAENRADQLTVQAIVQISHGLGKKTIAEVVENEASLQMLRTMGVDYAQGFHIARPQPITVALSPSARAA